MFTLRTPSGKERVVLTDPSAAEYLFFSDEEKLSRLNAMRNFNERAFRWKGGGIADPKAHVLCYLCVTRHFKKASTERRLCVCVFPCVIFHMCDAVWVSTAPKPGLIPEPWP